VLTLSSKADEWKPLPLGERMFVPVLGQAADHGGAARRAGRGALTQGLTLVHFSGQHKHLLWDTRVLELCQ